jgi:diaminopropionate ammonia-lyase
VSTPHVSTLDVTRITYNPAMQTYLNASVRRDSSYVGHFSATEIDSVQHFYDSRPELPRSPLVRLTATARALGLADLLVQDETHRFGLEAFKITGAMYAIHSLTASSSTPLSAIVCATAGNHGRAVAHAARRSGVPCTVFIPAIAPDAAAVERATRSARIAAMRGDGATTIDVDGSYEEAVRAAADFADRSGATVVADTAWVGYDEIPRLIMLGYTRVFEEASRQWHAPPDIVFVQGGVGGLVCAAANWFAARYGERRPTLIACEPDSHACLLVSARAGARVDLGEAAGPHGTIMAGLRCATPSPAAWPSIQTGVDGFVSIPDAFTLDAMEMFRRPRAGDAVISAGPSGACGLGALLAVLHDGAGEPIRHRWPLQSTRAMVVVTESP